MSQTTRQRLERLPRIARRWRWSGLISAVRVLAGGITHGVVGSTRFTTGAPLRVRPASAIHVIPALCCGGVAGAREVAARNDRDKNTDGGDYVAAAFDRPGIPLIPRREKVG